MPKITQVKDHGCIVSLTILDNGVERVYHLDGRIGMAALDNLQCQADAFAFGRGFQRGFLACLEIEYRVEPQDGLVSLAAIGYDFDSHGVARSHTSSLTNT